INAMAQDSHGKVIDPYGGQRDIQLKLLRHVSPAFSEDPLRVLRVARFAARFAPLGFTIAPDTMQLMQNMVKQGELAHLVAERVWQETRRALMENSPATYFEVLRECGALAVWFSEIDALFGVPQRAEYHPEIDCGIHVLLSLTAASNAKASLPVRWAALTHDLGKALTPADLLPRHHGHEKRGIAPLNRLHARLKTSTDCADLALLSAEFHTHTHRAFELKASTVIDLFNRLDVWRKPERFEEFLQVCEADSRGRTGFEHSDYPQANYLRNALKEALTITAQQVIAQGHTGPAIRQALNQARVAHLEKFKNA
ncbi:MAG: multifunctional CCA addition/repair protein, partial [Venatoribacter sp.]